MADQKVNIKVTAEGAKKAQNELKGVEGAIGKMGKAVGIATTAYFGARGLISGLSTVIQLSAEQELAEKKLSTALGRTSQSLLAQASSLQKVTTFGDEAIISQQAFLASLNFSEERIKEIIPLALDLSSATGMALDSAVRNVSKTFSGLQGELGELIPQLKELTQEELKAGGALEVISELMGGSAQENTETLAGKLEQTRNAVLDAGESLGELLAPTVIHTANAVAFLSDKLVSGAKFIGDLILGSDTAKDTTNEFAGAQKKLAEETEKANVALKNQLTEEQLRNQLSEKTVEGYQAEIAQLQELKMALQGKSELDIEIRKAGGSSGVSDAIKEEIELLISLRNQVKFLQEAEESRNIAESLSFKTFENNQKEKLKAMKAEEKNMATFISMYPIEAKALGLVNDERNRGQELEKQRFETSISGIRMAVKGYIAEAIASSVSREIVTKGGFAGIIAGTLVATAVSALFDKVVPKFAQGGIVQGDPSRGDVVPVMATAGELILNQAQQENLVANSGITINISAPLVDETVVDSIIPAIEKAKSLGTA